MVTGPVTEPVSVSPPLTVLYDGTCPLCRREIGIYRDLPPLRSDSPLCFADVSDAALPLPPGTTRQQLLARFHVRGLGHGAHVQTFPARPADAPALGLSSGPSGPHRPNHHDNEPR